jgi:hypothetical protein
VSEACQNETKEILVGRLPCVETIDLHLLCHNISGDFLIPTRFDDGLFNLSESLHVWHNSHLHSAASCHIYDQQCPNFLCRFSCPNLGILGDIRVLPVLVWFTRFAIERYCISHSCSTDDTISSPNEDAKHGFKQANGFSG